MTTCKEWYLALQSKCKENIEKSFDNDLNGLQAIAHAFLTDITKWQEILKLRPEAPLLDFAQREYLFSLLALVQGQYRQAYMGLRIFIEQVLAAIYFSAYEMDLRLWMLGERDIVWQKIADKDNGIFSRDFINAFNPSLIEERTLYYNMAVTLYRECSEFIHGNYRTQDKISNGFEFQEDVFADWHEKAETGRLIVLFALCARYLPFLNKEELLAIESSIIAHLGHIPSIHSYFDLEGAS